MKIWEKVNNITGNDSKSRYLVPYINAGSKFLLSSLPEKFLWTIASETEVNGWDSTDTNNHESLGQGSAIAYDKILAVYRYDGATTSTIGSGDDAIDYYRGKKRICAEAPDKNIHIFDEASSLLSATEMFPKFYKLSGKIFIKPDPDYNATASQKTYTPLGGSSTNIAAKAGDKGVIVYSAPPIIDENTDSWILTEYENIVIFYAASLDFFRLASTYRDLCKTEVDKVVGTVLTNYSNALPTFEPLPAEPSGTLTFSMTTALPNGIVVSTGLPTFSFTDSLPSGVQIARALPSGFGITLDIPTMDSIGALPTDMSITTSLPSDFSVDASDLPHYTPISTIGSMTELTHTMNNSNIDDALSKAKNLIDGGEVTVNAQGWLNDEDAEMVTATSTVARTEIERAQQELTKERNKLEKFSAEAGQRTNKYQSDITKYQADVQKEQNRFRGELEKFSQKVSKEGERVKSGLDKYNAEVQKESGRVQTSLSRYQRDVEKAVQKYQADISKYQQEVQKEASRAGVDVSIYNTELAKEKTRVETEVAKWQASINKAIQDFSSELQKYQAEVAKEGQRVSSEVAKYQAELQKVSTEMQKQQQQFTLDIQKYSALVAGKSARFQAETGEASAYLQEAGTRLQGAQVYTAKSQQSIQTSSMFYQRAVNELSAITGAVAAPEEKQSGQRAEQGAST
jgi:hypothetical protein